MAQDAYDDLTGRHLCASQEAKALRNTVGRVWKRYSCPEHLSLMIISGVNRSQMRSRIVSSSDMCMHVPLALVRGLLRLFQLL